MDSSQIKLFLQSMTNRLVVLCVALYVIFNVFLGQQAAPFTQAAQPLLGFELFYFQNPEFKPWQLLSHIFLHGSFTHLLVNMIALWSFGRVLEKVWGMKRFLIFFVVSGIGAGLLHLLVSYFQFNAVFQQLIENGLTNSEIYKILDTARYSPQLIGDISKETMNSFYSIYHSRAVGASGAIYGILVAFAMLFPNFKIMLIFLPVPIAAKYFVPVLLMIDLLLGLFDVSIFGFNIAHFAHLGGAVAGFLLVMLWGRKSQ